MHFDFQYFRSLSGVKKISHANTHPICFILFRLLSGHQTSYTACNLHTGQEIDDPCSLQYLFKNNQIRGDPTSGTFAESTSYSSCHADSPLPGCPQKGFWMTHYHCVLGPCIFITEFFLSSQYQLLHFAYWKSKIWKQTTTCNTANCITVNRYTILCTATIDAVVGIQVRFVRVRIR